MIWDLGPHDFSILLYWLSEMPVSVRALGRDSVGDGVADMAFVTMAFASGIVVNVELSWLAPSKLRRTTVVGSERMVVYEDGGAGAGRRVEFPRHRGGDIVSPSVEAYEPLGLQLGDFVRAIRAGDLMEYQSTLARSVVRIAEAADESLRLGGAEVSPVGNEVASWLAPRRGLAAV